MKIQLQQQSVRLRLDESELALLLEGEPLHAATGFGAGSHWSMGLQLHVGDAAALSNDAATVQIRLPREAVLALASRLPCREGLAWELDAGDAVVHLQFDVDVRDSMRERGPRRRAGAAAISAV